MGGGGFLDASGVSGHPSQPLCNRATALGLYVQITNGCTGTFPHTTYEGKHKCFAERWSWSVRKPPTVQKPPLPPPPVLPYCYLRRFTANLTMVDGFCLRSILWVVAAEGLNGTSVSCNNEGNTTIVITGQPLYVRT